MRSTMTTVMLAATLLVIPVTAVAQDGVLSRLHEVLPADVRERVIAIVTEAQAQGIPGQAIANLALEGVAKGRSGAEVLAAAEALAGDLSVARDAVAQYGHQAAPAEIEAAAQTMALGVDAAAISALAQSTPSGRSLAVPIAVLGALSIRELPSDWALAEVLSRLEARADDLELAAVPAQADHLLAQGMQPSDVGLVLAATRAGFTVPVGPTGTPFGPPAGVPANGGVPGNRPGAPPIDPPGRGR